MVKKKVTLEKLENQITKLDKKVNININNLTNQMGNLVKQVQALAGVTNRLVVAFAGLKQTTENRFESLEESVKFLPTTEQYLSGQSELMGELKKLRDEQTGTHGLYETTTKRIEIIDEKLGINSLTLAY